MNKLSVCLLILLAISSTNFLLAQTQSGIRLAAVFAECIQIHTLSGDQINFYVNSIDEYENGVFGNDSSVFVVNSTSNFAVNVSCSPFTNGADSITANNFGVEIYHIGSGSIGPLGQNDVTDEMLLMGEGGLLLRSGMAGNRGDDRQNVYSLHYQLGTVRVRDRQEDLLGWDLGSLLSQGVAPKSYNAVMTLTARAMYE